MSHWLFTFHLILPLQHFSRFLRFTSQMLKFFLTIRLWYTCRNKHRCVVLLETCLHPCWLNLFVKSPSGVFLLVRTYLTKDPSSLWSQIRGRPLRNLFFVFPLFLDLTRTSDTVPQGIFKVSAICCSVYPAFRNDTIFFTGEFLFFSLPCSITKQY